jgi:hypothetical protein
MFLCCCCCSVYIDAIIENVVVIIIITPGTGRLGDIVGCSSTSRPERDYLHGWRCLLDSLPKLLMAVSWALAKNLASLKYRRQEAEDNLS